MYISPSTWLVPTPAISRVLTSSPTFTLVHSQGSPGPEVRVAGMTFDSHCPLYALPAQRWFRPVHGDKSQLELTLLV